MNITKIYFWLKFVLIWLLVNFIITLLPVMYVIIFTNTSENTYVASIIAFIITRIIASIYTHVYSRGDDNGKLGLTFWFSLFVVIVSLLLYPAFLQNVAISKLLITDTTSFIISSLVLTSFICFLLHRTALENIVEGEYANYEINRVPFLIHLNFRNILNNLR
jgi:hypothetical protein